jgi:tetratricopeptide (TPR) repeat protein
MPSSHPDLPETKNRADAAPRLVGWKEIAAHLGKTDRTVKRWGKSRGLPIHRVPGVAKTSVYAYPAELDRWLESAGAIDSDSDPDIEENPEIADGLVASAEAPFASADSPVQTYRGRWSAKRKWATALAAVVVFAVALDATARLTVGVSAAGVAHRLLARRSPSLESSTLAVSDSEKAVAHELYLKGIYEWNKRTPESLERALDLFTQAVVHDPGSAKNFAGLAETYLLMREYSSMPDAEAYSRALAASRKAVELDDSLAEAHRCLAYAEVWGLWNFQDGEKEFRRAIELDPQDPLARLWFANAFHGPGWYSVALHEVDRAQELDPGSSAILADKGMLLFESGQKQEGLEIERQVERTDPGFLKPHYYLARMHWYLRDYPEFLQESEQVASLRHDPVLAETNAAASAGFRRDGEHGLLTDLQAVQKRLAAEGKLDIGLLASTSVRLGEKAEAVRLLQEEFDHHLDGFPYARCDLDLLTLSDEPGYRDLIDKLHVPNPPTIAEVDSNLQTDMTYLSEGRRP